MKLLLFSFVAVCYQPICSFLKFPEDCALPNADITCGRFCGNELCGSRPVRRVQQQQQQQQQHVRRQKNRPVRNRNRNRNRNRVRRQKHHRKN